MQPLSLLDQVAPLMLQCRDTEGCIQRAAASGFYPQDERLLEQDLAAFETRQGALRMNAPIMVLTPFTGGTAVELSNRLWRKRLLPVGQISYNGRTIRFSREYLADIAESFRQHAYYQVPLQLAGADNRHTNDVERYAGQVADLNLADDGLYITVAATERGDRLLPENPGLGVSARIVESYQRSDGRHFPAAIQHVLATLDPKVPALGPWSVIEASTAGAIMIDLSSVHFEGDEPPAAPSLRQQALATLGLPPDATPEEIGALMEALLEADEEDALLARWSEGMVLDEQVPDDDTQLSATLGSIERHIELSNALDELRVIEDSEPLPRLAEDRLAHLLSRVAYGSYTPQSPAHPSHPGHPARSSRRGPTAGLLTPSTATA